MLSIICLIVQQIQHFEKQIAEQKVSCRKDFPHYESLVQEEAVGLAPKKMRPEIDYGGGNCMFEKQSGSLQAALNCKKVLCSAANDL